MAAPDVVFHFDPLCPWTWMTSRWLTEVAAARSLNVGWRSLSLRIVNGVAEGERPPLDAAFVALRTVEALAADGDHAGAARFYTALGGQVHRAGRALDAGLVAEALAGSGLAASAVNASSDPSWDAAVTAATGAAVAAAGGGIGSPVLLWPATGRAISGPIVSPPPTGADAVLLWDAVTAAVDVPGFFELKRGREGHSPQVR